MNLHRLFAMERTGSRKREHSFSRSEPGIAAVAVAFGSGVRWRIEIRRERSRTLLEEEMKESESGKGVRGARRSEKEGGERLGGREGKKVVVVVEGRARRLRLGNRKGRDTNGCENRDRRNKGTGAAGYVRAEGRAGAGSGRGDVRE